MLKHHALDETSGMVSAIFSVWSDLFALSHGPMLDSCDSPGLKLPLLLTHTIEILKSRLDLNFSSGNLRTSQSEGVVQSTLRLTVQVKSVVQEKLLRSVGNDQADLVP